MIVSTSIIVLEKRPYRESALLLRGISPDCGSLSLVAHRAQTVSEKSQPAADLFRELEVEYRDEGRSELFTADRLELLTDFDALAAHAGSFRLAGKIAAFLLKNLAVNLAQPFTYDALRSVLSHLAAPGAACAWTPEQCAVVIKSVYLYENGLLPEGRTGQQNEFMENLVAAGIENSELPRCDAGYWRRLHLWLNSLLDYHQLRR